MEAIPFTPGAPSEDLEVTLAGKPVRVVSRWNEEDAAFYLDFYEISGQLILASVKVVLGVFMGRRSTHPFFVGQALLAWDTSNSGAECGVTDLGSRVQILYLTSVDLTLATSPPKEIPQ